MIIDRINKIKELLAKRQSLLILGPRGAGKSFLVRYLLKQLELNHLEIDLLLNSNYRKYKDKPSLIYSELKTKVSREQQVLTVFIDEIQRCPEILNEVHKLIEEFKSRLNFVLTGSSARKLKRSGANLLAGRALLVEFFPLTHFEVDFKSSLPSLIQWGSLPEIFQESDNDIKQLRLDTYVNTYLAEEISLEAQLRNIDGFGRFLEVAAQLNGEQLNRSKIARAANISNGSVSSYFEILEETLIAYKVPAWEQSKIKQLIKSPKYFFFDNGVLNALSGNLRTDIKEGSYLYGRLFENLVVNELIRYNKANSIGASLYHYRTKTGQEIDLILQKNPFSTPFAIEIKSTESPEKEKVSNALISFKKEYNDARIYILSRKELPHEEGGVNYENFIDGIARIFEEIDTFC